MEHAHSSHNNMTNALSAICLAFGLVFKMLNNISFDSTYNFLFKILSLVSVIMVVIINWPKAKEQVIKFFKPQKNADD